MGELHPDLLLINPGGAHAVYQELGNEISAIEPPLWLRLIGGYVRDRGFSVAVIDAAAEGISHQQVASRIAALRPRLVAVVVYGHQPSASTQSMPAAGAACRAIKTLSPRQCIILLGGHVAALPERTLTEEAVDFVCNSEGPVTVLHLLEHLQDKRPITQVAGLVWRQEGEIQANPPPPMLTDLDGDLHGDIWDLLPMERYRAHNWHCFDDLAKRRPYASIYTSLGCPFSCSFCCINAPFGKNRYRMRSPQAVVAEIDQLVARYGVRTIKIIDEMFVLNQRHVSTLCDLLIQRDYGLNIWAYARVDTVKPAMLDQLRRAGILWLALGIESGSAHVRDGAEKSLGQEAIIAVVRRIQEAGIRVIGNFIFGLPDDTHATMAETLALAKALNCEFVNFYSAMAYPGSALYRTALAEGWPLPEKWSGYSQHSHDCHPLPTRTLSAAEVLAFRDAAFHDYFANPVYLEMLSQRFGPATRAHVEEISRHRLRRQLLEGTGP